MFSRSDRLFTTERGRGNDETESKEKQRSYPGICFKCPNEKDVSNRLGSNTFLKISTRAFYSNFTSGSNCELVNPVNSLIQQGSLANDSDVTHSFSHGKTLQNGIEILKL